MKLDLFLKSCSQYCAYVPGLNTVMAGIDAVVKKSLKKDPEHLETSIKNRYIQHLSEESWRELGLKAIPLIGNIAAIYWDFNKSERQSSPQEEISQQKKELQPSSISNKNSGDKEITNPKYFDVKSVPIFGDFASWYLEFGDSVEKETDKRSKPVRPGEQLEMIYYDQKIVPPSKEEIAEKKLQALSKAIVEDPKNTLKNLLEAFLPCFDVGKQNENIFSDAFEKIKDLLPEFSYVKYFFETLKPYQSTALGEVGAHLLNSFIENVQKFNNLNLNTTGKQKIPTFIEHIAKDICKAFIDMHDEAPAKEKNDAKTLSEYLKETLSSIAKNKTTISAGLYALKFGAGRWIAKKFRNFILDMFLKDVTMSSQQKIATGQIVDVFIDAVPSLNKNNILEDVINFAVTLDDMMKQPKMDEWKLREEVLSFLQKLTREEEKYPHAFNLFFSKIMPETKEANKANEDFPITQESIQQMPNLRPPKILGQSYMNKVAELEELQKQNKLDEGQKRQLERLKKLQEPENK